MPETSPPDTQPTYEPTQHHLPDSALDRDLDAEVARLLAEDAAIQEAEDAAALFQAAGHPALVECQHTADQLTTQANTHPTEDAENRAFAAVERVTECAYAVVDGDEERAAQCGSEAKDERAAMAMDLLQSQGPVTPQRLAALDHDTRELLEWYAAPFPLHWLFPPETNVQGRPIRPRVVVLFHGPGGLSFGLLRILGVDFDLVGVDVERNAVATATAAGFTVIHADVTTLDPESPALKFVIGIAVTPPCQPFSESGLGLGRTPAAIATIRNVLHETGAAAGFFPLQGTPTTYAPRSGMTWTEVREGLAELEDPRAGLMCEVAIWPLAMLSRGGSLEWVAVEQSAELPADIEEALFAELTQAGWHTREAFTLDAVTYGAASHRKRRFLTAYRGEDKPFVDLTPTEPFPITTFAQCVGWPTGRTYLTRGNRPIDPATGRPKGGSARSADRPSTCVTATIYGWTDAETGDRITQEDIGRLVGFPGDYPWRYIKPRKNATGIRAMAQLPADALCPMVAAALFGRILGIEDWEPKNRSYVHELYRIAWAHQPGSRSSAAYGLPIHGA